MRSIDEQLREITARSEEIRETRAVRRSRIIQCAAAAVCLAVLAALPALVMKVPAAQQDITWSEQFGSIVITGPYIPYVVIGCVSFLLGISFTMLCIHVQKDKRSKR